MINPFMHRSDLPLIFQNGTLNDYENSNLDTFLLIIHDCFKTVPRKVTIHMEFTT